MLVLVGGDYLNCQQQLWEISHTHIYILPTDTPRPCLDSSCCLILQFSLSPRSNYKVSTLNSHTCIDPVRATWSFVRQEKKGDSAGEEAIVANQFDESLQFE